MKILLLLLCIFSFVCSDELTSDEKEKLQAYLNTQILDYFEPLSHPLLDSFFDGTFYETFSQVTYYNDRTYNEIAVFHNKQYHIVDNFESLHAFINPQIKLLSKRDVKKFADAVQLLIYFHCDITIARKDDTWLVLLCERNSITDKGKHYTEYDGYAITTRKDGTIAAITSPKGVVSIEK